MTTKLLIRQSQIVTVTMLVLLAGIGKIVGLTLQNQKQKLINGLLKISSNHYEVMNQLKYKLKKNACEN